MSSEGTAGLMDCPLCALPLEVVTRWKSKETAITQTGNVKKDVAMVQCRCMRGHWYAGPVEDLLRVQS